MSKYKDAGAIAGIFALGCTPIAIFLAIGAAVGAICWPYTINTWLEYIGKDPVLVWWQGALMGFVPVLGQLAIPAAVATWVLMLFIGGA